ncbi:MAG: DUF4198 domain-containing protein [Desulfobacteraceae bacterium]|nr:DUF4198 domain-containing protein [Desulfobacteraceae bacterium]
MKQKCTLTIILMLLFGFCWARAAAAHDMWIEVRDYTPAPGEEITMTLTYDHHLPGREFLSKEYLHEIYMLRPDGSRTPIQSYSEVEYKAEAAPAGTGTHLIVATQKGRFWTKTTEGYQSGKSKKEVKEPIACTYSAKSAKAIINIGAPAGTVPSKPLGHDLEIVSLADPGGLRAGDFLPVKVLFKGQPLSGADVVATYVGFSREKNTFAYATKSGADGVAKIRIATPGAWLVAAHQKEPYPDPKVCDESSFAAILTFEIQ